MITTDEQLISLTHAIKNCPVINDKESQTLERGATSRNMDSPGEWNNFIIPDWD